MESEIKLIKIVVITLALTLVGCASPVMKYSPIIKDASRPYINNITTVSVGEYMLKQGKLVNLDK